jgi:hypothetical protein
MVKLYVNYAPHPPKKKQEKEKRLNEKLIYYVVSGGLSSPFLIIISIWKMWPTGFLPQLLLTPEDSYSYCAELLQQQSSSFIQ